MTTPAASTGDVGHDFDPFAPDYLADPYPILDALRERVPVFYAPALDMWVVTRFAEIDEIFRNPARFSAANAQDPIYPLAPEARQILAVANGSFVTMACRRRRTTRSWQGQPPRIGLLSRRTPTSVPCSP